MKMRDFEAGRLAGLEMALRIAKKDGVEGLEKELKFRGKTGLNTPFNRKDLENASQKIKEMTIDTMRIMSIAVLHDEFGFGEKRCLKFLERMERITDSLIADMATWEDYQKMIREEVGINMEIRWNK